MPSVAFCALQSARDIDVGIKAPEKHVPSAVFVPAQTNFVTFTDPISFPSILGEPIPFMSYRIDKQEVVFEVLLYGSILSHSVPTFALSRRDRSTLVPFASISATVLSAMFLLLNIVPVVSVAVSTELPSEVLIFAAKQLVRFEELHLLFIFIYFWNSSANEAFVV